MKLFKAINTIRISIIFFATILFSELIAQTGEIRFERIANENVISQSAINHIHQDEKGFMWFATKNGIIKFDGYQSQNFKSEPGKTGGLSTNYIQCMAEDDSVIWFGTIGGGLNKYNKFTGKFGNIYFDESVGIAGNDIYSLLDDENGNLWIGTTNGLSKYDKAKNQFKSYRFNTNDSNSISGNYVRCLARNNDKIWIGTFNNGLNLYDYEKDVFIRYQKGNNGLSSNRILAIEITESGVLWIGTDNGLNRFEPKSNKLKIYQNDVNDNYSLSHNIVTAVFEDSNGILWIGTYEGGLNLFDSYSEKFYRYMYNPDKETSISSNKIWSIVEDMSSVIWIGTNKGANKYDKRRIKFKHYSHLQDITNSLADAYVWSICQDIDGKLWVGTQMGLNRIDRVANKYEKFSHKKYDYNSLSNNSVKAILLTKSGEVWIGTNGGGLNKFIRDTKKFIHYRNKPHDPFSLSNDIIWSMIEDKDGYIWIGTDNGLNKFDPKTGEFERFMHNPEDPNSLAYNEAYVVLQDKNGSILVGTDNGLSRLNPETGVFTNYNHNPSIQNSLSNNSVMAIHESHNGTLWVGTINGLDRRVEGSDKFSHYNVSDGLPNEMVCGILEDKKGHLWIATNNGLSKFDPENETFKNFNVHDGLQGKEFHAGASYLSSAGEMFFGGVNGFNAFFPENIKDNEFEPPIVITQISIFNKPIKVGETINGQVAINKTPEYATELHLTTAAKQISFEFAALHYSIPEKNKYAYKLKGFNNEWISVDAEKRLAIFTNLEAGKYLLKIKGTNSDGVWNYEGIKLKVVIKPEFIDSIWFKAIIVVFIIGLFLIWYKMKIVKKLNQRKMLKRKIYERNNEILEQKLKVDIAEKDMKLLSEIGYEITKADTIEKIIEIIYKNINILMDATIFAIGIYDNKNEKLVFPATIEKDSKLKPYAHWLTDENRLSVWCYKNQRQVFVNDFSVEHTKYIQTMKAPVEGESPMSVIYYPLTTNKNKIGVITVQSFKHSAYEQLHIDIIKNLAITVAFVIESNCLHENKQTKKNQVNQEIIASELLETLKNENAGLKQYVESIKHQQSGIDSHIKFIRLLYKSLLPEKDVLDTFFDSFIISKSKNRISTDFYWFTYVPASNQHPDYVFVSIIDCKYPDFSSAVLSLMIKKHLEELIETKNIFSPAEIFDKINQKMASIIKPEASNVAIDMCLCRLEPGQDKKAHVVFAGAKRPLFYFVRKQMKIKVEDANNAEINGSVNKLVNFNEKSLLLESGDIIYLSSNGFEDQLSPKELAFGQKNIVTVLNNVKRKSLAEQKHIVELAISEHQKRGNQTDDITFWGIKI